MKEFEKLLDELNELLESLEYGLYHHKETADDAKEDIVKLFAKLVAMHQATGASSDGWHLWPRCAMTRDGKAVGDVPGVNKRIMVLFDGQCEIGTFDGASVYFGEPFDGWYAMWSEVDFWYSLPAITTSADGNMELPF